MANNDKYFDNDRFDLDDRFGFDRFSLESRSRRNRDCDYDDEDDFDFCEDACDTTGSTRRTREYTRRNTDCERDCDRDRDCEHERDCDCDCKDDHDKCKCHDHSNERCHCTNQYNSDCCESTIHCSDRKDFNEDERFGCRTREDAAQSDDSWFECSDNGCCLRCRELCKEDECFCKKLKCRIQVLDFALQETILFLDTHPCDIEALRYYRIIRRKLNRLERIYTVKCGPLTNKEVNTEFGWEWSCCPWPWEGKE